MGHMWGAPLPAWFNGNHVAIGLVQMILSAIVLVINRQFFTSGFKAFIHKAPNMDSLVALGSGVSFVWSVFVLFQMTAAMAKAEHAATAGLKDLMENGGKEKQFFAS